MNFRRGSTIQFVTRLDVHLGHQDSRAEDRLDGCRARDRETLWMTIAIVCLWEG